MLLEYSLNFAGMIIRNTIEPPPEAHMAHMFAALVYSVELQAQFRTTVTPSVIRPNISMAYLQNTLRLYISEGDHHHISDELYDCARELNDLILGLERFISSNYYLRAEAHTEYVYENDMRQIPPVPEITNEAQGPDWRNPVRTEDSPVNTLRRRIDEYATELRNRNNAGANTTPPRVQVVSRRTVGQE